MTNSQDLVDAFTSDHSCIKDLELSIKPDRYTRAAMKYLLLGLIFCVTYSVLGQSNRNGRVYVRPHMKKEEGESPAPISAEPSVASSPTTTTETVPRINRLRRILCND